MTLSQRQKDLLIGSLLGDGNLQTVNGQTWRYRAIQKAVHEPYIMHKYNVLKEFCKTPPTYSSIYDERTKKSYQRYSFNTLTNDAFRFYGQMFYTKENNSWKKIIPQNIEHFLTPTALAYWYMDDGALKWAGHSNAVRLCTDSFAQDEVLRLQDALINKFGLNVSIQKKNNISRLSILENSYPKLKELIVPDLLPCMFYKFPDGNKGIYENEQISNDINNTFIERDL